MKNFKKIVATLGVVWVFLFLATVIFKSKVLAEIFPIVAVLCVLGLFIYTVIILLSGSAKK